MKIYEVGGAVRDSLIGLEVNEKDWVVVIAKEIGSITSMNTWMRRIDLSCKVLAPWAVGAIISSVGNSRRMRIFYGAAAVGLWNAMAYPMELMLTTAVFYAFPAKKYKNRMFCTAEHAMKFCPRQIL